ncbi:MAG: GAF domain-containing protein [Chloroflexia bacterium]|nr:GAF domain-containing protein [Chloroflexia bacterium]
MEDLTQSQVRTLEGEAALLKKTLQTLIPQLESAQQLLEASELPASLRANLRGVLQQGDLLFKQVHVLLERLDPAMRALREDAARTRREREQLATLYEISQVLNSTLSLEPLLDLVMDRVIAVTGAERGFLTLLDEESGELRFAVARNIEQQDIEGSDFQVSRGVIERVTREGQPVLTDNASEDPRFADRASVIYFGLRSIMAVPLRVKDNTIGGVYVDNHIRAGIFSEQDLSLLNAFANQAAIAIENARLFDDLQRTLDEIREIKTYMDDIFASVDSGILTTDEDGLVMTLNRAAGEIFALPENKAKGRRYLDLFGEIHTGDVASCIQEAQQQESRFQDYEISCKLPRRGEVALKLQIAPLKDAREQVLGVTTVVEDLTEERRLRQTLNRYLAPSVAQEVLRMAATGYVPLGGTRRIMSILFADIRGFTSFSEQVGPEELVDILNGYLTIAARAILRQEGTLDKFMGDAVMALFNVPVPQEDHTLRAAQAALDMQRRIAALDLSIQRGHFQFGVGLHVGEAVAGNVGSPERLDYTAIGDAVNLARRLQEVAHGGQILLSETAYQEIADRAKVSSLGPITVKGRAEPVLVYELLDLGP